MHPFFTLSYPPTLYLTQVYVQAIPVSPKRLASLSRAVRAYLSVADLLTDQLARIYGWCIKRISGGAAEGAGAAAAATDHFVLVYEQPHCLLPALDLATAGQEQRRQLAVDMVSRGSSYTCTTTYTLCSCLVATAS